MKILRMEAHNGHGPFDGMSREQCTDQQKELYVKGFVSAVGWARIYEDWLFHFLSIAGDETHPHHMQEGLQPDNPLDGHEWRVGVTDMDQFHHWFPEKSMRFFREKGFFMAIYEVDEEFVHVGRHQVLFCLDQATLVNRRQLY